MAGRSSVGRAARRPDRPVHSQPNIATVDQIKDTNVKIDTLTTEVSGLKDEVADLRGQLRAQKLLSNP
jgi:hypothetical protein